MLVAFATVLGILIVDQGLKFWVLTHLALGQQMELVPGFLSLTHIQNRGASWGILPGAQGLFIGISLLAVAFFSYKIYRRQASSNWVNLAYACLVGWAVGNLLDRLLNGYVVDMLQLDFISFPIFNLADTALTVGVLILLLMAKDHDLSLY
ncbi:signal peptidase II [Abiotrophia defectiva]